MKFPQEFIDRVREATDIVPLISQYVQLRRGGGNYMGLCPFHGEKSPSFSVSEDKQVYYCFGCKKSGNVITFVMDYQGLTFPEAIESLARRASLPLPAQSEQRDPQAELRNTFFKINALAAQFFHQQVKNLPADHEAKKYLDSRGLNDEMIDQFKIGFDPNSRALTDFFEAKRVPMAPTEQLGLLKRSQGEQFSNKHYDFFRNRVIFPIFSPTGQCLGFGGRVLSKEQQPKYLNSSDSPIFHKGKVFYGLDHSAKYIRTEDEAIVVEGYMDWLALAKVSIHNIVATLGTALTADHAKLIKRYTNKVLLLFDGDEAGKGAARRSLPILLSEGILARGLFLPDELDPDEFIGERGETALRELIRAAPDLFELITTEEWLKHKSSPTGKIQLMDEFAPILAMIPDERLRSLYCANFANMCGVDLKLVEQSVKRAGSGNPAPPRPIPVSRVEAPVEGASTQTPDFQPRPAIIELIKVPRAEVEILNLMLMKEVYLKETLSANVGEHFAHSGAKTLFNKIAEEYGQMPSKFDTLSASLADKVKPIETITRFITEPYASLSNEAANKLLQDCIKRVKSDALRLKHKALVSGLSRTGEANPSEQLEQIMNIHKDRRSLNRDS
ncbi:MAG: DNA primase [Bdellovibrionales bacterium]